MSTAAVFGSTSGLKATQVARLERLTRRRVVPSSIITPQLASTVAELSRELGRQVGLIINRKGLVEWVVVGDPQGLLLPDLGRHRAGSGRFRGLRLVHTHLDGRGIDQEDLTDLVRLRLDLVAALQVGAGGEPGSLQAAHLLPENPQREPWKVLPLESVHHPPRDYVVFIEELEAEFRRKADLLRGARSGEGAVVVHVALPRARPGPEASLAELAELARTAGVVLLDTVIQRRAALDPRTFIGKGKVEELVQRAQQVDAELLLVDHDLSPHQVRALSEATDLKVIDRTTLILDIFAQHAQSREGKLQVELAQLRYALPRLAGHYGAIMRQAGGGGGRQGPGVGTRGPGEKKLELDRRRIKERITKLEAALRGVSLHRSNRRQLRQRRGVPVVALVGYTNAGKSTLLNTLTHSDVVAADRLFATLDPTSRRLRFPREREVILSDTVGFIRDLPKDLLRAFKATLEELAEADLLLHVVDASDPARGDHVAAVRGILEELELDRIPRVLLLNKVDRLSPEQAAFADLEVSDALPVCALERESTRPLLDRIEQLLWERDRIDERWAEEPEQP